MYDKVVKKFDPGDNWYEYKVTRFFHRYPPKKVFDTFVKKHSFEEKKSILHSDYTVGTYDVAIMFSGGFDSLSLTLKHLEAGESVMLLSIGFNSSERVAAKITINILKAMYGDSKVGISYILGDILVANCESTTGLTQQPVAAFLATLMPDRVRESIKSLEFGYCMNDDALSYLSELRKIYYNAFLCKVDANLIPTLKFPLLKKKHYENIDYVAFVEKKYNVLFPAFSAEYVDTEVYEKEGETLYFIRCGENSNKENKKCNITGYIVATQYKAKKYYKGLISE